MWSHPKEHQIEAFRSLHLEKQIGEGSYGKVQGKVPTLSVFVKRHLSFAKVKPIWSFAGLSGPAALYTGGKHRNC